MPTLSRMPHMQLWAAEMAVQTAREQCSICRRAVKKASHKASARCCTECAQGNVDLTDCHVVELAAPAA